MQHISIRKIYIFYLAALTERVCVMCVCVQPCLRQEDSPPTVLHTVVEGELPHTHTHNEVHGRNESACTPSPKCHTRAHEHALARGLGLGWADVRRARAHMQIVQPAVRRRRCGNTNALSSSARPVARLFVLTPAVL